VPPQPFSVPRIALASGIINVLINVPLGFAIVASDGRLPTWGLPGVAADVVATAFGIGFGTALIGTGQFRKQVRAGKLAPPVLSAGLRDGLARWPAHLLHRAVNVGVLTVLAGAPLPLLGLLVLSVPSLDQTQLVWLKGSFSFVIGASITPLVAAAAAITVEDQR